MKIRITNISVVRTSMIIAGIYTLLVLVSSLIGVIMESINHADRVPFDPSMITTSLFIIVLGYCGIAIACAIYNLVAKWTGGIEITIEEK